MNSRTIFSNVYYPLRKLKLPKEEKEKKIRELLSLVDIADKENAYPGEISGRQKQRAAIARALATDPDILLCDEATSALDPKTTLSILELLKSLNEKLNLTIVIITHEMQVIKEICNKCAVMENGQVIESGDVYNIFARPRETLTKEFIQTTENKEKILKHVKESFHEDEQIYQLKFLGDVTTEPFIVDIYQRFGIVTNILFGNVEYISGKPLGNFTVSFRGDADTLSKSIHYLRKNNVIVEVINV